MDIGGTEGMSALVGGERSGIAATQQTDTAPLEGMKFRLTAEQIAATLGVLGQRGVFEELGLAKLTPADWQTLLRGSGKGATLAGFLDAARMTAENILENLPGRGVLGGEPDRLSFPVGRSDKGLATPMPDLREVFPQGPRIMNLDGSFGPPPIDPEQITHSVLSPEMVTGAPDGGLNMDRPVRAIRFCGAVEPDRAGREQITQSGWDKIAAILKLERGRQIPHDSETAIGRAACHIASRFLEVQDAIDSAGGRAGLTQKIGNRINTRVGETVLLLTQELQLGDALTRLTVGDFGFAIAVLQDEREGCKMIQEEATDPTMIAGGFDRFQDWAAVRAGTLRQLIDDLRK